MHILSDFTDRCINTLHMDLKHLSQKTKNKQFLTAVLERNIVKIQALFTVGVNLEVKDKFDSTALILATSKGYVDVVTLLLQSGANIKARNKYDQSAFLLAACQKDTDLLNLFIHAGADVNDQSIYGGTGLLFSAKQDHTHIVNVLIQAGANLNPRDLAGNTPLIVAARYGHINTVTLLIKAGADTTIMAGKNRETALTEAIKNHHYDVAKLLVKTNQSIIFSDKRPPIISTLAKLKSQEKPEKPKESTKPEKKIEKIHPHNHQTRSSSAMGTTASIYSVSTPLNR